MKLCERCNARFQGDPYACPLDGTELTELPDPMIARVIGGRYRILDQIGAGGTSTVYRARHEALGRLVAIKFLLSSLAADSTSRERFLREARATNRINHDHIVDITDYGETEDGHVYLVMEYMDGIPLDAEIYHAGPFATDRALGITLQVARALGRAHELDVIHRDVKPGNVYLLRGYMDDFVKLLDFGLAHVKGDLRVTATGTVFGTPEYMAPEQARGGDPGAGADLYAIGCTLFEMLTGKPPFDGVPTRVMLKHMREPAPAPSQWRPEVPREVDQLVSWLLDKDPSKRPATAYVLADRIQELLSPTSNAGAADVQGAPEEKAREATPQASGGASRAPVSHTREASDARTPASVDESWSSLWRARIALFRQLTARAYPQGNPPAWLRRALESLESRVEELRQVHDQLENRANEADRHEDEVRQTRQRIGHAVDELGRDEARVARQLEDARARLQDADAQLAKLGHPLLGQWHAIPPPPVRPDGIERDAVTRVRRAGEAAARWLEAEEQARQTREEAERLETEREDLRFQIRQLKGRLASLGAASDYDLGTIKRDAIDLEQRLQEGLQTLMRDAEPIVRHFMGFPQLRSEVLSPPGSGSPSERGRSKPS